LCAAGRDIIVEEQEQKDFFISYNHRDGQWAEWIAWELEHAGYTCTIQAWDFIPGANFVAEMHNALLRCQRVVAIVSANYLTSAFVTAEWTSAYADDPVGKRRKLLPIRVEDIEIGGLLKAIVYVDLVGKDEEAARQAILAAARVLPQRPNSAPEFPNPHHRVEFPQINTIANSSLARFAIVLTATIDELNKPLVEAIVKHLRQFAPDSQFTLEQIQRGSVVLTFRATRIVFLRLQIWLAQHRPLLLGMPVRRVSLLSPDDASASSDLRSPVQTERDRRFSDAAALYFALDEVLGPNFLCTLAAYLNFEDDELRKATARLLLSLAHFSDATLPMVLTALDSRSMKHFIVEEIRTGRDIGYPAVGALVASQPTTEEAVKTIAELGYRHPARVAADALAVLEVQPSPIYEHLVISFLERLGSVGREEADDASVKRIVYSLSRRARRAEPAYDQEWAIRSLARLYPMDSSVQHALRIIGMDERSNLAVCVAAIQALIENGDLASDLADRLFEIVETADAADVVDAAVKLLAVLRSANAHMLEGLVSLLSSDKVSARRAAAKALGSMGYNAATVLSALTHCLSDHNAVVRENAQAALDGMRRAKEVDTLALEELLTAEDKTIREQALSILRKLREEE
jgi:hypothetical protein